MTQVIGKQFTEYTGNIQVIDKQTHIYTGKPAIISYR